MTITQISVLPAQSNNCSACGAGTWMRVLPKRGGEPPRFNGCSGLASIELYLACYESASGALAWTCRCRSKMDSLWTQLPDPPPLPTERVPKPRSRIIDGKSRQSCVNELLLPHTVPD